MKKLFIIPTIIIALIITFFMSAIFVISLPPKLKNIEQINLYLQEYDLSTFNEKDIIVVNDKKEIKEILEILKLEEWELCSHSKGMSFQHNPPGVIDIVFKNGTKKRYEYFETKKGYYFQNNKLFYFAYWNDSLQELKDKYKKEP